MTSVPDTPGDMDDELSGVSPELVLIDPDLAQKLRERAFDPEEPRAASAPVLRLVRARSVEASETLRPPVRVEQAPPPAETPSLPRATAPAPTEAPAAVPLPATPVTPSTSAVAQPRRPASANLAERLAGAPALRPDAEPPIRAEPPVESVPLPVIEAHPLADQHTGAEPPPLESHSAEPVAPEPVAYAAAPAVMPHPVTRPTAARVARASRPRRRGRRALGFLTAVAVASVAVLGITNLTGGSVPGLADGSGVPTAGSEPNNAAAKPNDAAKAAAAKKSAGTASRKAGAAKKQATKRPARPLVASTPKPKKTAATSSRAKAASKPARPKPPKATSTPPKSAATRQATKPAATKPAPTNSAAATKPASAAVEPRRFAWAPVDGAVAYHVELFKGPDRVFARDTSEPVLELGSTWRHEGKTVALTPGNYRWYVWPVTKSGRATQAVVQAELTVP